jgi:Xaa-Pro aminopeptidase
MTGEALDRHKRFAREAGLDALIAASPENVGYTVGYMVPSQTIAVRKRQFFAVTTPSGRASFLVVNVEHNEAKTRSRIQDVRPYNEFTEDAGKVLASLLRELGVSGGRLGIEMDFFPARTMETITRELPKARFVDAERIFDRMRMVKTPEEIDRLRRCGRIVDEVHAEVYAQAHPGMTELELASRFVDGVLKRGADYLNKIVVGSGARSVFANCPPTTKVLQAGDVMRVDAFASIDGYMSDIARTTVVGKATREHTQIWQTLVDAQNLLLDLIRPGASTGAIWRSFLDFFQARGLEPGINFVGHGLGLTLHEEPYISRYHDSVLEEGMVLAIEPVFFTRDMGFHLEDELIVTAGGYQLISDGRKPLVEIR